MDLLTYLLIRGTENAELEI